MAIPLTTPTQSIPLDNLLPSGKTPKTRLGTASQAASVYGVLWQAQLPRLQRAGRIGGMFDGNPPYEDAKLRKRNEGWRANFNSLEGESRADSAKGPFYDLVTSVEHLADCRTEIPSPAIDANTASDIRTEEFDRLIKGWPSFDWNFWAKIDDFIKFGKGYLWFPRPDSWHFKHQPWNKVLFPNGTSCDPDEWELFVICHEWSVTRFYSFIADGDAAEVAGWNVDECYEAIRGAQPRDSATYKDPLALTRALRDSDFHVAAQSQKILCASVFVKEFDGTWSRMIISTPEIGVERNGSSDVGQITSRVERQSRFAAEESRLKGAEKDWLYFKKNVADDLFELMCPFVYEVGDNSINALRGLGQRIVSLMSAKDRMRCEMVNNVFMRSAMTLQAPTGGAQAKAGLIQLGPLSIIPPGFTVQPGSIFGDIEGNIVADQTLDRLADVNTGTWRPQFEKPTGNPESATAANIRYSQATVLSNSAVNRYYKQLDRFYIELYRRVSRELPNGKDSGTKTAREFQKRCLMRGLSMEQLRDVDKGIIRATRAIGNGSPVMRQQMTSELLPLATSTDALGPRGRKNLFKLYVAARGGQHLVDKLFPREDEAQIPTRDQYDAVGENADFSSGGQVLFAEWQDHFIHCLTHVQAGEGAIQAVQQGADPSRAYAFLESVIPHVNQHIASIREPQRQKQANQYFKKMVQDAKVVEEAAQASVQNQGKQQQLSFDQQLAQQTAMHDAKLKELKAQASTELRQKVAAGKQQMDVQQTQHAQSLADATAAATITRETASTTAAIQNERASTASKIENERIKTEAQAHAMKNKPASKE